MYRWHIPDGGVEHEDGGDADLREPVAHLLAGLVGLRLGHVDAETAIRTRGGRERLEDEPRVRVHEQLDAVAQERQCELRDPFARAAHLAQVEHAALHHPRLARRQVLQSEHIHIHIHLHMHIHTDTCTGTSTCTSLTR